eukprot:TRINITY_DN114194_c0_g1_i1.p1 TRINITY_DN114194_c0_g1~~TRINITY_DN114194_c0_g1_i1.p1  ORF type:complete len:473 (-),score=64.33 TRINITY_DN114194_c0_g1_i1:133-1551(-)
MSTEAEVAGQDGTSDLPDGASLEVGDKVEILGLQSEGGKALNGLGGSISKPLSETGRFEVALDQGKSVSVKPQNLTLRSRRPLKKEPKSDKGWSPGDQARLAGLYDRSSDAEIQKLNSTLCKLVAPMPPGRWCIEIQSREHIVKTENLCVCTKADDSKWDFKALSKRVRLLVSLALVGTLSILVATEIALSSLRSLQKEDQTSITVPDIRIAYLASVAPFCSLLWIIGTVGGCYRMHESLMDPEVTFPQISELGVGPRTARVLYRVGFAAAAALLGATVLLHQELALPHLPNGRDSEGGADFTWYGLAAAAGVACQGVFLLEPSLTNQTKLHFVGALLFFYGAWCHMGAATKLYLPSTEYLREDSEAYEEMLQLAQAASSSMLLKHPHVSMLVFFRHKLLMRAPVLTFVVPLGSQLLERTPGPSKSPASSPRMRSAMGLVQWLVVLNFALIFLSYGPELSVAATLPMPSTDE